MSRKTGSQRRLSRQKNQISKDKKRIEKLNKRLEYLNLNREDLLSRITGSEDSSSPAPSVDPAELASIKERLDILEEWVQSHRAF